MSSELLKKYSFTLITITALLNPGWYILGLKITNGKIWLLGYLILLGLWLTQFITNASPRRWSKKQTFVQIIIGIFCFIPFSEKALTFLCWAIEGFGP